MKDAKLYLKLFLLLVTDELGRIFLECDGGKSLCLSTESFPDGNYGSKLDAAYCPVCGRRKSRRVSRG